MEELISERTVEREKGPALISEGLQAVAGSWRRQISRGAREDVAAEVNTREGGERSLLQDDEVLP